jgi:hypothetical protein
MNPVDHPHVNKFYYLLKRVVVINNTLVTHQHFLGMLLQVKKLVWLLLEDQVSLEVVLD